MKNPLIVKIRKHYYIMSKDGSFISPKFQNYETAKYRLNLYKNLIVHDDLRIR